MRYPSLFHGQVSGYYIMNIGLLQVFGTVVEYINNKLNYKKHEQ